jgi:OmpA-OmpF porin, OOP family
MPLQTAAFFKGHLFMKTHSSPQWAAAQAGVVALGLALTCFAGGAQAQAYGSGSMYLPGTGYIGLNAGQSDFRVTNGNGGFPSDKKDTSYSIYAGGYFSNYLGAELGYIDFGKISRAGGSTKAEGIQLSLVGKVPLADSFNLTGRLGTTYGRTDTSANILSGVGTGKANGFGVLYGIGLEYAFSPQWSAVVQYDEQELKFVNSGRDTVNVTSAGVRYRF